MKKEQIVTVSQLRKVYGKKGGRQYEALKDVSFNVTKGEFVAIMGSSGAGKTTLLNMLATFDKPTSGYVTIAGHDVTSLKGKHLANFRGQEIGFIFQDFNLLESLTVAENIRLPLSLQGVKASQITPAVEKIAETLEIAPLLAKYPAELSGGQKQRVAVARSLVHQPSILLGDEPTGALDSKTSREMLNLLEKINREQAMSILIVTHDPFTASYCQRIIFIKDGQVGQEIYRGNRSRQEFYQEILDVLGTFE
ncbi:ABC transporter ATP-binding protein [Ligilactobacillus saerimneri]|uniref:ABC transporter ATP-binding protein n=1 Tax=Ligilactobacillus saerimneri TaxID=228229 RepID=UPI0024B0925D|nr:ABC transporter ATP-binding protein [Ligilactobacillus saerimneri]MDI9206319.1 ABC transporter ATP-binding protein [Ligilactobacillus saerimneri]